MDKLSKEEVLHVAKLAKIKVSDSEIESYEVELKKLLNEIDKIDSVKGYDEEMLIAPWNDDAALRKDEVGKMLDPKDVIKNAPRHSGNYIEVPVVINE